MKKKIISFTNGVRISLSETYSVKSEFILRLLEDVEMKVTGGHDPLIEEVYAALFEMIGDRTEFTRKCNFRFCRKLSSYRSANYLIEVFGVDDIEDGFPKRRFILHESSLGKVPEIKRAFLYDLLDLGRVLGFVAVEDGKYKPSDKLKTRIEELQMKIELIDPRYVSDEDGWGEYRLVDI